MDIIDYLEEALYLSFLKGTDIYKQLLAIIIILP